jgi:ribulose-phosphate 3-epimerase
VSAPYPEGVRVAPSILSADFARLGAQVAQVMDAGARVIHVDVMDGHFVPPITIGPLVAQAISAQIHEAGGWMDVHLMINHPERHIGPFAEAGADSITLHQGATPHVNYALNLVREAGCRAGLALNPSTPAEMVGDVIDDVDLVLCMSVNPGWGGQTFIPHSLPKLARLRDMLPEHKRLMVDGGVDAGNAEQLVENGASLLVAGSAVFGAADPKQAYADIAQATGAR